MAAAERACSSFMRERSWSRPPESSSIEKREENLIFLMATPESEVPMRNNQTKLPSVSPPN